MHNEGELADGNGKLACFDPSVCEEGPSCLLVRKDLLLKYLDDNNLRMFWLLEGEKRILSNDNSGDVQNPRTTHQIEGFYCIENGELKGDFDNYVDYY